MSVPYDVTEPTHVYIYGGTKPSADPAMRRATTEMGIYIVNGRSVVVKK